MQACPSAFSVTTSPQTGEYLGLSYYIHYLIFSQVVRFAIISYFKVLLLNLEKMWKNELH